MKEKEIHPDMITFNTLIHMYCQLASEEGVKTCLQSMSMSGYSPDVVTYGCLIGMYAKVRSCSQNRGPLAVACINNDLILIIVRWAQWNKSSTT